MKYWKIALCSILSGICLVGCEGKEVVEKEIPAEEKKIEGMWNPTGESGRETEGIWGEEDGKVKEVQPSDTGKEREKGMEAMDKKYGYEVKEYKIPFGEQGEIYGKLYYPKEEGIYGAVILSHGYNGSHSNFDYECKTLASNGYVAYAYDFRNGSVGSRSGNQTTEMTIFTEKDDLLTVFEAVSELPMVDPGQIVLFGGSQGGFVTALAAEELKTKVRAVVMYYPAFNIPDDWRNHFKDEESIPDTFDFWGMKLGKEFFRSIREFDTFEHIGSYKGPVLIIYGDKDPVVPMGAMEKAEEIYEDAELIVLEGEGHGFSPAGTKEAVEDILQFIGRSFFGVE